jgi:hypothetical protein
MNAGSVADSLSAGCQLPEVVRRSVWPHSLPSACHCQTASCTENTRDGLGLKAAFECVRIPFRRNRLVAAALQKSAHIKPRESRNAELSILLHVHEFVKQETVKQSPHLKTIFLSIGY